jgi:hypothetical protein
MMCIILIPGMAKANGNNQLWAVNAREDIYVRVQELNDPKEKNPPDDVSEQQPKQDAENKCIGG